MNKKEFIRELAKRLAYSKEKCIAINDILESNFFLSKNIIIEKLTQEINVSNEEAAKIYAIAVGIIKGEIKNKLIHPFKNQD